MENAAEALKMAFGVFVLVIALSVSIYAFSKTRETSDIVIRRTDITEFYEYQDYEKSGKLHENRVVGLEEIIPMLYRYCENDYTIVFKQGKYNPDNGTFDESTIKDLTIYNSQMNGTITPINTLSLKEEIDRQEYWTISKHDTIENLKMILSGKNTQYYGKDYIYFGNPLTNKDNKYVEYITSKAKDENDYNDTTLKMQITYILIK